MSQPAVTDADLFLCVSLGVDRISTRYRPIFACISVGVLLTGAIPDSDLFLHVFLWVFC